MSNDWGKPITPEELAKIPGAKQATTVWPDHQQIAKPTEPNLTRALETIMHPDFGKTIAFEHRQELVPQITDGSVVAVNSVGSYYAPDGTLMNADGTRSIFDDVDAFDGDPMDPTPATIDSTPEELAAKGWVQTAHDEWEKIAPDTSPFAGSKVTLTYVDEAHITDPWKGRENWTLPDINGDEWPTHPDQTSPMTVERERYDGPMGEAVRSAEEAEAFEPDGTWNTRAPNGEPEPRTAPVETYSEADGPWYVVYFGPVLYTVLAGPYETEEAAAERIPVVWGQFEHDAAYDYTFPVRERSGLRAATVRTVYNLKGAYGKQ